MVQPFFELRNASYFGERWVTMCIRLVYELERQVENLIVYSLHPFRIKRACILDLLLAYFPPARVHGRIIFIGSPGMNHVARANLTQQFLRVAGVRRILHRIEVIEVAEELIEAVNGGQKLIEIAKM